MNAWNNLQLSPNNKSRSRLFSGDPTDYVNYLLILARDDNYTIFYRFRIYLIHFLFIISCWIFGIEIEIEVKLRENVQLVWGQTY